MTTPAPELPDDVRASFLEVVPDHADDQQDTHQVIDAGGPRRVDLGNGDWAVLIDPTVLRAGHRKRALAAIPNDSTNVAAGLSMTDGIAMIAIQEWSLPLPLPKDDTAFLAGDGFAQSLDQLTFVQEQALHDALRPYHRILFRRTADSPSEPGTRPTAPSAD